MTNSGSKWTGIAIALLAVPIWILVVYEVSLSRAFGDGSGRFVVAPAVLCGLTVAMHRLLRTQRNAWPLSAVAGGGLALGAMMWAAG